jgi:P60-related lipoprotein
LLVKSGDSNVDVTKIAAFKGIKKISSTSGDLSYSLSALKEQKSPIYGLMDPNNSKIYSSDSFTFAKLIKHIKKAPLASLTDEKKAEIAAGKNKTIEEKDINLKNHTSGLGEITKKVDGKKTTFSAKYELDGKTYNVEYTIESITYDLEKSNNVNVKFKMTVKELAARHYTEFRSLIEKEKD